VKIKEKKSLTLKGVQFGDLWAFLLILTRLDFRIFSLGFIGVLLALIELIALLVLASFVNGILEAPSNSTPLLGSTDWFGFKGLSFSHQAVFCVVIFFARFVLGLLLQNFILRQTNELQVSLRSLLFRQALKRGHGTFGESSKTSGAMADVIVRQVTLLGKGVVEPCLRVCGEIAVLLGILAIILAVSPQLMVLMVMVASPVVWFYVSKFKNLSRHYGQRANHALEEVSELSAVFCAGWRQLSVPTLRDKAVAMVERSSKQFAVSDRLANLISSAPRYFLELFLALFLIFVVFWVSLSEQLRFLELVFVAGAGLRILPIITSVSNALISFQFNRAVLNNIVDIISLDLDELISQSRIGSRSESSVRNTPRDCSISLRNISFSYKGQGALFERLNEDLRSGDFLLITGKSGVGKTTLMDVICGIRPPSKGSVLFNGNPQKENTTLPVNIFYVPQQPLIIPGTVLENIVMLETKSITDLQKKNAICALKMVGLWDLVKKMPWSLNANVGPDGDKLSGGQRQRLVLARALYHGAEVFALDEVVSGLEVGSKREILTLLRDLTKKSKLIILISHDTVAEEYASKFIFL
jgi:ABC-type multidrug transport system fused ATPase/permease subunit